MYAGTTKVGVYSSPSLPPRAAWVRVLCRFHGKNQKVLGLGS